MALKLSTGLRNDLLGTSDFKTTFTHCKLEYYTGAQPATSDDAATGALLLSFHLGATGLTFDVPSLGVISKAAAETWSAVAAATGTAGYFRLSSLADANAQSTTLARLDGAIGTFGADLNLTTTAVVTGATHTVSQFDVTIPTA